MKNIFFVAFAIVSLTFISCKKETVIKQDDTIGLVKIQEIANDSNVVELYNTTGVLQVGYNDIYLRVKDKISGTYNTDATIDWMPVMHMMSMSHSCPKSTVAKVAGKPTLQKGYLVFLMPNNSAEKWTLSLNIQTNSTTTVITDTIAVANSTNKRLTFFTGTDSKKYIVALVQPAKPAVAINDLVIGLFVKENSMSYPSVANYSVMVDPRMPSMGNHTSPNNKAPVFMATDNFYHGQLSLTMTGYWKLNLIVKNTLNDVLKGEEVTPTNESSSLYLDLEF